MEPAGLVLGALGIAGLFKSCVDNFDIIVRAREFSEEFDLLCTELSLQQIRLVLWGESLGFVPAAGKAKPLITHQILDRRPQVRRAITDSLLHLQNLLTKADVITGRYDYRESQNGVDAAGSTSRGMVIFRDTFQRFKSRLDRNQAQKSAWKVTRWSVHDYGKFRQLITNIKNLLDGLESITSSLGLLERQRTSLMEEIESISDTESLRLLQNVGSLVSASPVLRLVSDRASQRMSDITSGKRSYHTAPSHPSGASVFSSRVDTQSNSEHGQHLNTTAVNTETIADATHLARIDAPDIPQNQRWMSALYGRNKRIEHPQKFTSSDQSYGQQLVMIKQSDERSWAASSTTFLAHADQGMSLAQRIFLELRSIRRANVPFISAAPVHDSLDRLLASVEGPPGTPYEGGVFWITVKIIPHKPPLLRFQTRIYHPNISCTGELCADYESWWTDVNLSNYMSTREHQGFPWFSEHRANHYSLGALLVAICGLLSNPNVDDPLVPEIAEKYITDYDEYFKAAKLYTDRYATHEKPPEDELFFAGDIQNSLPEAEPLSKHSESRGVQDHTDTSSLFGQISARGTIMIETVTGPQTRIATDDPLISSQSLSRETVAAIRRKSIVATSSSPPPLITGSECPEVIRLSQEQLLDARFTVRYFNHIIKDMVYIPEADMPVGDAKSAAALTDIDEETTIAVPPILQKLHEWAIVLTIALSDEDIPKEHQAILEFEIQQLENLIDQIEEILAVGLDPDDWVRVLYELESTLDFTCRFMKLYALAEDGQGKQVSRSTPKQTFAWPNGLTGWHYAFHHQRWAEACYKKLLPVMSGSMSLKAYNAQYKRGKYAWAGVNEVIHEFRLLCGYLRHVNNPNMESSNDALQRSIYETSKLVARFFRKEIPTSK